MQDAALGIITDEDRNLLLILRKDVSLWVLPGGGIEEGETPEGACIREVYEESGIQAQGMEHVATYIPINRLASTTHLYASRVPHAGTIRIDDQEVAAATFFPLNNLPHNLFIVHRQFLDDWQLPGSRPIYKSLIYVSYLRALLFAIRHPSICARYLWTRAKNSIRSSKKIDFCV